MGPSCAQDDKRYLMYDLIVIGGGPAGTSAAITAARSGARVLLLERGRFPRHKVCGEFVSAESLDLLAALLDSQYAALQHDAIRIPRARLYLDRLGTRSRSGASFVAQEPLRSASLLGAESLKPVLWSTPQDDGRI